MRRNLEQLVNRIFQATKISSPPINAKSLAEFYFGLDFDCDILSDDTAAMLSVAEKKIYMNELFADKFAANVGFKNFTIAHELAELFAVYLLMSETFVRDEFVCRKTN